MTFFVFPMHSSDASFLLWIGSSCVIMWESNYANGNYFFVISPVILCKSSQSCVIPAGVKKSKFKIFTRTDAAAEDEFECPNFETVFLFSHCKWNWIFYYEFWILSTNAHVSREWKNNLIFFSPPPPMHIKLEWKVSSSINCLCPTPTAIKPKWHDLSAGFEEGQIGRFSTLKISSQWNKTIRWIRL